MSRREEFTIGRIRVPNTTTANQGSRVTATLTPAAVATVTVAAQTLTLPGVELGDLVIPVITPITTAVSIADVRVTAANTISVRFNNPTAGSVTPDSGAYTFLVIKG